MSIYLTINRVQVTVDKLGARTFKAVPLVRHLRISATDLAVLRTKQLPESSSNSDD
jgi:hypothetical protein